VADQLLQQAAQPSAQSRLLHALLMALGISCAFFSSSSSWFLAGKESTTTGVSPIIIKISGLGSSSLNTLGAMRTYIQYHSIIILF
jgi:hypothetical protein